MKEWQLFMLLALLGYLIGSISFARILFHIKRPGEEPVKIRTVSTDGSIVSVPGMGII